jgi:hypothetical protein
MRRAPEGDPSRDTDERYRTGDTDTRYRSGDGDTGKRAPSAPRGMRLATVAFGALMAWFSLEIALRLLPGAISPRLLILFEPGLRAEIGSGRFPLEKDFREISRDDGGPPLLLAKPRTKIISVDAPPDGAERFTDEEGFCNPPGRYAEQPRIQVITVGDSFTWCHALPPDATWTARLSSLTGVSTFSLGQGGKGPYEYVQFLREFGLAKKPRVVVMNIYAGNDLRDAAKYRVYRAAVEQGAKPPGDEPASIAPQLAASVVGRHSYALNFVVALASRAAAGARSDDEKKGIDFHYSIDAAGGSVPFNLENRDRDEVVSARHLETGAGPLEMWDDALARFAKMGAENGFVPIVSLTPSAYEAYGERAHFVDASLPPLLARFNDAQRAFLRRRAAEFGFVFFDLTPAMREAAAEPAGGLLYDPTHMHLSARGHEVLATAMASLLQERGLAGGRRSAEREASRRQRRALVDTKSKDSAGRCQPAGRDQ